MGAKKYGCLRYGELHRAIVGITPKILSQTLKELEVDELMTRKVYVEVPPKVEYSLTETAKELIPFISQINSLDIFEEPRFYAGFKLYYFLLEI